MPCCINRAKHSCCLALLLALVFHVPPVLAEEPNFKVLSVETRLEGGVYLLTANLQLQLTEAPTEALENGVPLYFLIDVEVIRERQWWADKSVAEVQQTYRLEYHPLSRRYLVININTGVRRSFGDIDDAMAHMGLLLDFPLLDRVFLEEGSRYLGNLQVSLDLGKLPLPLLTNAYLSTKWDLESQVYGWLLK